MLSHLLPARRTETRNAGAISWPDYLRLWEQFGFNGVQYVVPGGGLGELTALQAQRNPIVWACIAIRAMVFSEIGFANQDWVAGRPGKLSTAPNLQILNTPWAQAHSGDLLSRMEVDASLYGNSYWVKSSNGKTLIRLKPTRTTIATVEALDEDTGEPFGRVLIGYAVNDDKGHVTAVFTPDQVCHYRPLPDPEHEFRGISWMSSLLPDIIADLDMSDFKHSFMQNAATPSLVVKFDPGVSPETAVKFKEKMEASHTGAQSGFKTLYMGAGADVKVVGSNFQQLNINAVQQAGETRIAAAAGVPPTLLSLSESLGGSALNAGNYAATRRRFADATMRPLWRMGCGALETIAPPPAGKRLWYDERLVSFLQEDVQDSAVIKQANAQVILTLVQAGFYPDSVIAAVESGDMAVLKHTGLVSVSLQKPGPAIPAGGTPQDDPTLPAEPGGQQESIVEDEGDEKATPVLPTLP